MITQASIFLCNNLTDPKTPSKSLFSLYFNNNKLIYYYDYNFSSNEKLINYMLNDIRVNILKINKEIFEIIKYFDGTQNTFYAIWSNYYDYAGINK